MNIYELDSPAVYLDLDIFEKNAKAIRTDAVASGKKVRPHFKAQ